MSKVSIIGAGNVGATAAMKLASKNVVDNIVLLDIKEGIAEGKAMDIMQCSVYDNFKTDVSGVTNDYSKTSGSDVIVITSGVPRKPGMSREDLVGINSSIMKSVVEGCDKYSPNALYVVVSNPMDTMTYQVVKILKSMHPEFVTSPYCKRVIGMGGMLDSSRFRYYIYKALNEKGMNVGINAISGYVEGAHSDKNMVPVKESVTVNENGYPWKGSELLTKDEFDKVVEDTMKGGATLTGLLGTSAWEAPGACIAELVRALISGDPNFGAPCSIYDESNDVAIGMFITVSTEGVRDVYLPVGSEVITKFAEAVKAVKVVNEALPKE